MAPEYITNKDHAFNMCRSLYNLLMVIEFAFTYANQLSLKINMPMCVKCDLCLQKKKNVFISKYFNLIIIFILLGYLLMSFFFII